MIYRQSSLQRIKGKFDTLKRFSPEEYVGSDLPSNTQASTTNPELAIAIKVRIWKVLQSKFQDRGKVQLPRQLDWTDDHFDRSLNAKTMIEHDHSFAEDITESYQRKSFEDLHDEESEYILEDIADGSFFAEDYRAIEHDAFDDLLWDESLANKDSNYFTGLNWEQSTSPCDAQSIDMNSPFTDLESNPFGESLEHPLDAVPWSVYGNTRDELLDVSYLEHQDEELDVAGPGRQGEEPDVAGPGHQDGPDYSLPNDIPPGQVSQLSDLALDLDFQHEMMMDD